MRSFELKLQTVTDSYSVTPEWRKFTVKVALLLFTGNWLVLEVNKQGLML